MTDDIWKFGQKGDSRFYLDVLTHDIKNLNQGVYGYLELMSMMPDTTEKQRKFLDEALGYVRMSSNLINSIELDSQTIANDQCIGLSKAINDATEYFDSLNSNMDLSLIVEGLTSEITVQGNLLLVDVFLFLLDFMLKRCEGGRLRVNIRIKETLDNSAQVTLEGDFKPPERESISELFYESDPLTGRKRGKLVFCKSIVERFGGTVNYFEPSITSGLGGGGFTVVLKEVLK